MSADRTSHLQALFPTQIYQAELADRDLVGELEASIWMLEEGDQAGRKWCEEQGYDGYTSYASLDDLPVRTPAFGALKALLDTHADAFADALGWDMQGRALVLDSLWVNILGEGGAHSGHIHPNSVLSGTVYINCPDGAGALKLEDPRLAMMMAAPPPDQAAPESAQRFVYLQPAPGRILFWESWLRHEVMPNTSEAPRLSISYNFALAEA